MTLSSVGADAAVVSTSSLRAGVSGLRILIVDDHDIIRRGLKSLLNGKPGWEVCGEGKTGKEAVATQQIFQPTPDDVVVIDNQNSQARDARAQ